MRQAHPRHNARPRQWMWFCLDGSMISLACWVLFFWPPHTQNHLSLPLPILIEANFYTQDSDWLNSWSYQGRGTVEWLFGSYPSSRLPAGLSWRVLLMRPCDWEQAREREWRLPRQHRADRGRSRHCEPEESELRELLYSCPDFY